MAYSRPSTYSYPRQFKSVDDAYSWAKQLYAELKDNDVRSEELGHRVTDKDLKELIVRPEWYGAKGDGSTDDSAAINAAIQVVHNRPRTQGVVQFGPGNYFLAGQINLESGVALYGDTRGTYLNAHHTGSVINMTGKTGCVVRDLMIDGDSTTAPKCAILIARDSGGGGAQNRVKNIYVGGYYSAAPVYMVSAEDNYLENLIVDLQGGGAMDCVRVSHDDDLGLTGFTVVSSWNNIIINPYLINRVANASGTCITLTAAEDFNGFSVVGGRFINGVGTYITVRVLGNTLGGITFINPCGERLVTVPGTGINFSASGAVTMKGAHVFGGRLDATTPIYINPSITAKSTFLCTGTTGMTMYDDAGTLIDFNQSMLTTDNVQHASLGLGTAATPDLSLLNISAADAGKASSRLYATGDHSSGARAYYLKNRAGGALLANDIVFDEYGYAHDGSVYRPSSHRYSAVTAIGAGGEITSNHVFEILNANATVTALILGALSATFGTDVNLASGKVFKINGTQVLGAAQTGVSAMSNLSAPSNLDADTVSTAELADIVGNLINKLRTQGIVAN